MSIVEIKRAGKEDAQLLSDLSDVTFMETYRDSAPDKDLLAFMDECYNEKVICKELEDPDDFYFIVFADGFPAGYMRLTEDDKNYPLEKKYKAIHLKRIYVLREYQSKKMGAALMQFALQFAGEKNYEMLFLGVWERNEKAKLFYKKFGFEDRNLPHTFFVGGTTHTDYWLVKFIEKS
jgi:ribosomal protein S18 acetylase RimI-like enzyme